MKAFIAAILAALLGIFVINIPGFYIAAIALSMAFSLLVAGICFVSAKSRGSQAASVSPVYRVAGVFALLTAIAGAFRFANLSNTVPVQSGFELLGWMVGALVTIGLSGAAILATKSRRREANM